MSAPPQVGFYILITDVGGRGGDVSMVVQSDHEQKVYTGPPALVARQLARYLEPAAIPEMRPTLPGLPGAIRRLLYGADQPTDNERGE